MLMMLASLFSWWYSTGWAQLAVRVGSRVDRTLETFSVALLGRTLFAPFRQISAGATIGGSLEAKARAFGDRVFSRVFGAFVRLVVILIGLIVALLVGLVGVIQLILWPLLPFFPILGLLVTMTGWTL